MTYIELRKSSADMTYKLNGYVNSKRSITIEADEHGISVRVWEKAAGNRAPLAYASRKCIGDALNEIDKQLKSKGD